MCGTSGASASVPTPPGTGNPTATLTAGPAGSNDVVTCDLVAQTPNYSGNVLTGVGGFKSCSPHAPYACHSEVDIWYYASNQGAWHYFAAGGQNNSCPPPYRSSIAHGPCVYNSSYPLTPYKTHVDGSIVYGSTTVDSADSPSISLRCI